MSSTSEEIKGTARLSASDIRASYSPHKDAPLQIRDVSLSVSGGEVVAVIGPNGCGKSTLIRVLSRTLEPSGGSVLLGGRNLYREIGANESARAISVVPQTADIALDFTVRDIVAMGRAPHRAGRGALASESREDQDAVSRALARMGISDELASQPISKVSGGERQRALIARCLAQEAAILLLDEPTSSLDLRNQSLLLSRLRELAALDGRAVLIVLHDLNLAAEHADRVVVMDRGATVDSGPPDQVLTPGRIASVYGIRAWVRSNPVSGRPVVLTIDGGQERSAGAAAGRLDGRRIHLLCGAGTGARLMFELTAAGAVATAAVLHEGDIDQEAASHLGLDFALASAFSFPTADALAHAVRLEQSADAAILTEVALGDTNRAFLMDAAIRFAESGRRLVVIAREGRAEVEAVLGRFGNVRLVGDTLEALRQIDKE